MDQSELFEVNETRMNVLKSLVNEDNVLEHVKVRMRDGFAQQYDQVWTAFKSEWDAKLLAEGATSIPLDHDAYAQAIFAREDYKTRKQKDAAVLL